MRSVALPSLTALFLLSSVAGAAPKLRYQADLSGDVAVFGSTLAVDCAPMALRPTGATVSCAGQANVDDTAPDLYYRDELANASITPSQARTSATLVMPVGAQVKYARLYWSALKDGATADTEVTLDWDGGPTEAVKADDTWVLPYGFASHPTWSYYQASGDVTKYVAAWGAGDFRVTGVDALELPNVVVDRAFSAWTLVVFYELPSQPLRNLALFDGFELIDPSMAKNSAKVTLQGFLVPTGFDAKMAAFTYEGDATVKGDRFTINGLPISNASNPETDFFNSSRTFLGAPVSGSADVPKLSGEPGSMASYDLDTVDISTIVKAGDTSAEVGAESNEDVFLLGGFVTSITNRVPDFGNFTKIGVDVNGGVLLKGDEIEFELTAKNGGNDASKGSQLTDVVGAGLEFVPGSLQVFEAGAYKPKTDAKDADTAAYDAASKTVTFYVGTGATGTQGGSVAEGETVKVKFKAKVTIDKGSVSNQAVLEASGVSGGGKKQWSSDGDPKGIGDEPTVMQVNECSTDADCKDPSKPHCDGATHTCQPCKQDADCKDPSKPACNVATGVCGQCSATNATQCKGELPACNTSRSTCDDCAPMTATTPANVTKCATSPDGPACVVGTDNDNFCGCKIDADCGAVKSGRVCDTAASLKCLDGCRGQGGNGCADGFVCTSKDSSIGQCVKDMGQGGAAGAAGAGGAGGQSGGAGAGGDGTNNSAAGFGGKFGGGAAGAAATGGAAGQGGAAAAAGKGVGGAAPPGELGIDDSEQSGACGCVTAGESRGASAFGVLGLALLSLVGRRRRRLRRRAI